MVEVFNSVYEQRLKQRLEEVIVEEGRYLAIGYAKDFEDYKERVGKITGLNNALSIMDDVRAQLFGKEKEEKAST